MTVNRNLKMPLSPAQKDSKTNETGNNRDVFEMENVPLLLYFPLFQLTM